LNSIDESHLRRAIELARLARNSGDAPFGSLLVDQSGAVVMEAHNTVLSEGDISAHPEFKIACWVARQMSADAAAKATLFTSCQPCEMCSGAIDRSGIGRVVFALSEAQLNEVRGNAGYPKVPQFGPYLYEAAAAPVRDHYKAR